MLCILVELLFLVQNSFLAHGLNNEIMFYISGLAIFKSNAPSSDTFEFSVYSWEKKLYYFLKNPVFFVIYCMLVRIWLRLAMHTYE